MRKMRAAMTGLLCFVAQGAHSQSFEHAVADKGFDTSIPSFLQQSRERAQLQIAAARADGIPDAPSASRPFYLADTASKRDYQEAIKGCFGVARGPEWYAENEGQGALANPDVFFIDGRYISIRLVTDNNGSAEAPVLADRLAITDVTYFPYYGRVFDPRWIDSTPFQLLFRSKDPRFGNRPNNSKFYILEIKKEGEEERIVFRRPDGAAKDSEHASASITLARLAKLRRQRAQNAQNAQGPDGKRYQAVPQYTNQFCWQFVDPETFAVRFLTCSEEFPPEPYEPPTLVRGASAGQVRILKPGTDSESE